MTNKYAPIIEELQRAQSNLMKLWAPLSLRQARVSQHSPGVFTPPPDISQQYDDGFREATDALGKAIKVLQNLNA